MKRVLLILLVVYLMTSSTTSIVFSEEPSPWAADTVKEAIQLGIVPKRLQSNYQLPITREEFAELAVASLLINAEIDSHEIEEHGLPQDRFVGRLTIDKLINDVKSPSFEDCSLPHVKAAYIMGIINGVSDTSFNPDANITRQEAATLMGNYLQAVNTDLTYGNIEGSFADKDEIAEWAKDGVDVCKGAGVMNGTGINFEPKNTYTREQAILCVYRAHKPYKSAINLRGKINAPIGDLHRGWEVGKDWVALKYPVGMPEPSEGEKKIFTGICSANGVEVFNPTRNMMSLVTASLSSGLFPLNMIKLEKEFYVDSGYMISQWYGPDYLIKFYFTPGSGLVSRGKTGTLYGRDKIRYDVTAIEAPKRDLGPEAEAPKGTGEPRQ